jgi:predicted alpha/beta hydrolase family esterase
MLDEETIVVGHSLGPAFLLNIIEKLNKPIAGAVFVSGFTGLLGKPLDIINKTFVDKEFDWDRIKRHCEFFTIIHSDDDPYIPLSVSTKFAKRLGTKPIVIKGGKHFNEAAGYKEFDEVLEFVKRYLSTKGELLAKKFFEDNWDDKIM